MNIILDSLANNINDFVTWVQATMPEKLKEEVPLLKISQLVTYNVEALEQLYLSLTPNEKEDYRITNTFLKDKRNPAKILLDVQSMQSSALTEQILIGSIKVLKDNGIDFIGTQDSKNVLLNTSKIFVTDMNDIKLDNHPNLEKFSHIKDLDINPITEALNTYKKNKVLQNVDKLKIMMITDGDPNIDNAVVKTNKPK